MGMRYNLPEIETSEVVLPKDAGKYRLKVVSAEDKTSKAGNAMVVLDISFADDPTYPPFQEYLVVDSKPNNAGKVGFVAKLFGVSTVGGTFESQDFLDAIAESADVKVDAEFGSNKLATPRFRTRA